ncbi:hypothetical protein POM88_029278 [Heracleum sosnowskyi]|uniref:Retrotransposon gag domain-containing protein n=1 Tax=Heracleum sosnowskyi TaxID=360622 RepID=A0AAD8HTK9_9APIA|nr:hypothetical protein POM88_029278 [Heracleum sosnowskyi]
MSKATVPAWYQSLGIDDRVQRIEQSLESLSSGQNEIMLQVREMFDRLSTRVENIATKPTVNFEGESSRARRTVDLGGSHRLNSSSYLLPKTMTLDFPRFNGVEDPTSWLCRAEQFFEIHGTPSQERVPLASFNLEGEAQLWYQLLKQEKPVISWEEFKDGHNFRYGPDQFFDFFGELT